MQVSQLPKKQISESHLLFIDTSIENYQSLASGIFTPETLEAYTAMLAKPYLVKDIKLGSSSSTPSASGYSFTASSYLTSADGILYFVANDGIHGNEVWKSDGTAAGTVLLKDINVDQTNYFRQPSYLTNVNGTLYFGAQDGLNDQFLGYQFWKTDGTEEGTVMIEGLSYGDYDGVQALLNVDGILYFVFENKVSLSGENNALWKTDGTEEGTVRLIYYDNYYFASIDSLINVNGTVFFNLVNTDYSQSYGLWKSDGTEEGTVPLQSLSNYYVSASNPFLTSINGTLFFSANDQQSYSSYDNDNTTTRNYELWKTDGTTTGTVLVKDINPGSGSSSPSNPLDFNGILYFNANDGTNGAELWKSDGTTAGTVIVKDINPGFASSAPSNLTKVNDIFYFVANNSSHGTELWKSDGTAAGTVLVKDINPGSANSAPANLTNINGVLYFVANDGSYGNELWKSDGTTAGTILVDDINPGSASSDVSDLTYTDGILYFLANDGIYGKELWALNTNSPINPTVSITATDSNAVEVGNSPSILRISRTGNTDIALALNYTIGGTATNGSDYTQLTGIASFAVGQFFTDITITPVDDGLVEGNETVTITLTTGIDYDIDTSYTTATVTIIDSFNIINSNSSRDPLIGTAGSDRILGGVGGKTITGGAGNDEFVYTSIREVGHRITDFIVGSDKIVLTQLLDSLVSGGYNGSDAIADGYVKLVQGSTANTSILQIDRDGVGGNAVFRPFLQLDNVTLAQINNTNNFVF